MRQASTRSNDSSTLDAFKLTDHTALITGAARGIGQSIAVALAEAGANIILTQHATSTDSTQSLIENIGRKVWIYNCDMGDAAQVEKLCGRIGADGHKVRILVNCAGIQRRHKCEDFPDSDFNEVLQVNLNSVFVLSRNIGKIMLELPVHPVTRRKGSIINIASLLTFQGGLNVPAYAAAKGAIGQLTKSMSNEWSSKGVNVNAIAPGYIETDMNEAILNDKDRLKSISDRIPAGRWGNPDDFKGPAVFLASAASSYICGHTMVVDGGWMGR